MFRERVETELLVRTMRLVEKSCVDEKTRAASFDVSSKERKLVIVIVIFVPNLKQRVVFFIASPVSRVTD